MIHRGNGAENWKARKTLHNNLAKAESSALDQIRTEKFGFAQFFFQCRVPNIQSASCENVADRSRISSMFLSSTPG